MTNMNQIAYFIVGLCSVAQAFVPGNIGVFTQFATPTSQTVVSRSFALSASIQSGDTVLVIGGTGGVGQLVTKKLNSGKYGDFKVRVTSRDTERGREVLEDDTVEVVELDLVGDTIEQQLEKAMEGVSAVVISVGTTAFPTKKWSGGNNPDAIDNVAVTKIAQAASKFDSIQKVALVTSVGIERTNQMPFVMLNLFGVLEAKKKGEDAVKEASTVGSGFDYVIVRPGRLIGGPFTNLDVAKLLQIEGGAENGVDLELGDTLLGDCKRDACSEAIVQSLLNDACQDITFCMASNEEKKSLDDSEWTDEFQKLKAAASQANAVQS